VADERDRSPVEAAETADDCGVVGASAVTVELDPVLEQALDVVQRVRTVVVPRELDRAPDLVLGRLGAHAIELLLQALELARELRTAEEADRLQPRQTLPETELCVTCHCRRVEGGARRTA
jgi:hypothetical protein